MGDFSNSASKPLANRENPYNPWGWWRSLMPVCSTFSYLDHAAVAALPTPAVQQLAKWAAEASELGGAAWPLWSGGVEQLREKVASWIMADPEEIALLPNTTTGINLVAEGWPWQPGDKIVILADDFPSNRLPWLQLRQRGVEVVEVAHTHGELPWERIDREIDGRTRLVAVSWVDYAQGYRLDLQRLTEAAHRKGAKVFVDAIQGLGVFPLDVQSTGIDFMAADGHKWMLGPEGAAVAYVRREHWDRLVCRQVGWNSVVKRYDFASKDQTLRPAAARWEGGSANQCGLLALRASLEIGWEVQAQLGRDAISERVIELVALARDKLRSAGATLSPAWPAEHCSGIFNFQMRDVPPMEIRRHCRERNIILNCRGSGVRVSVHAFNNMDDFDQLANALREIA